MIIRGPRTLSVMLIQKNRDWMQKRCVNHYPPVGKNNHELKQSVVKSYQILLEKYSDKEYIDFDDDSDSGKNIIYCNYLTNDDDRWKLENVPNIVNLITIRGLLIKLRN